MDSQLTRRSFIGAGAAAGLGAASLAGAAAGAAALADDQVWDYEYDIVVCGGGGSGLPAALKANDQGNSVLVVDTNWEIGGHCAICSGHLHLGGGNDLQEKYGIEDSADQVYLDHTGWKNLESRYNDREVVRYGADYMVETWDYIQEKGVVMLDQSPTLRGYPDVDSTVARQSDPDARGYVGLCTGTLIESTKDQSVQGGIGITRPLEEAARDEGVDFLCNYHLDTIFREDGGRVYGLEASYTPTFLPDGTKLEGLYADENIQDDRPIVRIKANKAIIVCTGGSTGNYKFRTIFYPALTEEYGGSVGEIFSPRDASGELAMIGVGASLGATGNQTVPQTQCLTVPGSIGTFQSGGFGVDSQLFPLCRATGLSIKEYDGVVCVNMLGERFDDETKVTFKSSSADERHYEFIAAAMSSVILGEPGALRRVGGPIWAIFDSQTLERNGWVPEAPYVDAEGGAFFSGDTLEELAANIVNKYFEDVKMDPERLAASVKAFNDAIDAGQPDEFGRSELMEHKIEQGPFYAAWTTPEAHDSVSGVRHNGKHQVLDWNCEVIPGLYAAGECGSGWKAHGTGKVLSGGYIAGLFAGQEEG